MAAPTILLTRPAAASARFAAALAARFPGVPVVVAPLMEIRPRPFPPGLPAAGLIFTSAEGVAAFAAGDARRGMPAFCVGARTAGAARAAGFAAEALGEEAEALLAALLERRPAGPLLHARGAHGRGNVVPRLRAAGVEAAEVVVYDQAALPLGGQARALLAGEAPLILPLFSPRSAQLLRAAATEGELRAPLRVAAMSRAVAEAWGPAERLEIAARPDAEAMLAAVGRFLDPPPSP